MEGLGTLAEEERKKVSAYYQELILDGMESGKTEEEVVAGFGDPAAVAGQILEERDSLLQKEERLRQACKRSMDGEARAYCAKGPVETVLVQVRDRCVEVRESTDGAVRVWFAKREGDRVSVEEAGGAFRFIHQASFFNGMFFFSFGGGKKVVVEIPHDFGGTVCVKTTNCRLEADRLTLGGKLQLVTTNGRLAVTSCTVGKLSGKTTNGRLMLEEVTGVACEAATSNGQIEAKNCRIDERLWLETSNGTILVEGVDAPNLSFHTSNGAIKGAIAGRRAEYTLESRTTNGHSNVNGGDGEKHLRAVTSNASIHLDFQDD